ncbi:MAG: L-ribulose-5-phosphate 4-epimerase [Candidatus Latescibacterota bacterium]
MASLRELRERVYEANRELPRRGMVLYTFGNVSGIDRERGVFAIKPSGVPYEELTPDMMVVLDPDCRIVEGVLNPSSDTKTHAVLYRAFPHIGGVVHTHSLYATAWAQAMRPIPCFGTTHADHIPGEIPCTGVISDDQIRGDYEEETGNQILAAFRDLSPEDVEMVLVACHGPFTWGKTPAKAVYNSVVLEELAKMALYTLALNPECGPLRKALVEKHYLRKHGKDAYYGQKE